MTTRHITCHTPYAVLLLALPDEKGVLRVAGGDAGEPGLRFAVAPLLPIGPQLVDVASAHLKIDTARHLDVVQDFADEITIAAGPFAGQATLYVATLNAAAGVTAAAGWPNLPDILRRLKGRERIPYLRAWQVLAGGLHLATKAIEASELAKHFDD